MAALVIAEILDVEVVMLVILQQRQVHRSVSRDF